MAQYEDVPQLVRDFLSFSLTIQGKSPKTVKEYYYDLRFYIRYLASVGIDDFTKVTLSNLYTYLEYVTKERNLIDSSRCRKVANLKVLYKYLHKRAKVIDSDPTLDLERPKIKKSLPKFLNIDESKDLLSNISGKHEVRNYAIITLFLNCGLRLSELVGINISRIKDHKIVILGKGRKERIVYLNPACMKAINDYLRVRPAGSAKDRDALFLSERYTRISTAMVQHLVKKNMLQSGLSNEYSTHKLRHTAATLMYNYGDVSIMDLKEILGHENLNTTQIYTHVSENKLREAMDRNPLANI